MYIFLLKINFFIYKYKYIIRTKFFLLIFLLHILKVSSDSTSLSECKTCKNNATSCKSVEYCKDGSTIKIVNNGTPGSVKFGKSGTPTGNYFFNSNSGLITNNDDTANSVSDQYTCNSSGCNKIPDNNIDKFPTYINSKAEKLNCAFIKYSSSSSSGSSGSSGSYSCETGESTKSYYDNAFKKVINCSSSKCTLTSAAGYYVNYVDSNSYIYCDGNTCTPKMVESSEKVFYLNAGLDKSSNPIIYCDGTVSTGKKCKTIVGDTTVAYLEGEANGSDYYSSLIICTSSTKCTSVVYDSGIFLSSEYAENKLIECSSSGCTELIDATLIGYKGENSNYIYYIDELSKKLIRCISATGTGTGTGSGTKTLTCELYTDTSNKYYLDYSTLSLELCKISSSSSGGGGGSGGGSGSRRKRTDTIIDICGINIISCDSSSKCKSSLIVNESNFIDGDKSVSF